MSETAQLAIPGSEQFEKPVPALEWPSVFVRVVEMAIEKGAGAETIERLVAVQERMLARQAQIEFAEALNRVQAKIKRIAPDLENPQTRSRYASYAAIDRVIRPVYSEEGFSLSFTERDCPKPEHVRIVCLVDRGAHTREYQKDMPCDGKGAKGGDVMTKTHAAAAADSYAKRYLVKDIFNIAIGQYDNDGNGSTGYSALSERLEWLANAKDETELNKLFANAANQALEAKDASALESLRSAKSARLAELRRR